MKEISSPSSLSLSPPLLFFSTLVKVGEVSQMRKTQYFTLSLLN